MTICMRAGAAILAIGTCVTSVFAQQPALAAGPSISGQVLSADSDKPLRRVRIEVANKGSWKAEPVLTGNDGRFSVEVSGTGPFTLTATKGGYLIATTTVQQADVSKSFLVHLPRGAVITGTAIGEDGQPVIATQVSAKRLDPAVDGFPATSASSTDDRGEFRLAGLPPGRYELIAGLSIVNVRQPTTPEAPVTVVVGAGDQIGGVQLTVPESRTRTGVLQSAGAALGLPSTPPRPPAIQSPGGIRGRVLTAAKRPVTAAAVRVTGLGINRTVNTDTRGAFSLEGLRPGRYMLEASNAGFAAWSYGQGEGARIGMPVVIGNRVEEGVDIVLPQYVALQGIVVDEQGEPVQGARVQALQVEYALGRLVAAPAGERRTDDRGSYRLWGLAPGAYVLSASFDGLFPDGRGGRVAYATMYYPGTPAISAASTLELRDDATINLLFAPIPLTQITGTARDGNGPLVGGTVRLVESRRPGVISTTPRTVTLQADGTFIIRNVPSGDYVLHVRGDGPGRTGMFGTETVSVGSDPVDVLVRTSHGMTLEGRLVLEGTLEPVACTPAPLVTSGIAITSSCNASQTSGLDLAPVAFDDYGRTEATMVLGWGSREFFATGLFGRQSFVLRGAPEFRAALDDNWYIKSFTVNGDDIIDSGFDFGSQPGTITDAEIVLSRNGASVSGRRVDGQSNATGYFVLVFPTARDGLPPASRRVKFTRSATDGSFRVAGLPAGSYLVAALSNLQSGEWQNPELLDRLAARAERITLSEGQQATLSVRLSER